MQLSRDRACAGIRWGWMIATELFQPHCEHHWKNFIYENSAIIKIIQQLIHENCGKYPVMGGQ